MRLPAPTPDAHAAAAAHPARRPALWAAAILILLAAIIAILTGASPGHAQGDCDLEPDQHGDTTPGETFNLTLAFTPQNCAPGDFTDVITITLHEDIVLPSGFNRDNFRLNAGQRFNLEWADINPSGGDDEPHAIELPSCAGWRATGASNPGACPPAGDTSATLTPISIQLRGLSLPNAPASDGDEYTVTIRWGDDGNTLQDVVTVAAALEISGDRELDYNDTARFRGYGFSSGLTVRLYAKAGSDTESCGTRTGNWNDIGTTSVDTNRRFDHSVTITTANFPTAGRYQICARDGAGASSGNSVSITVTAGLEVVGNSEVKPGGDATLRLIGCRNCNIDSVLAGGATLPRDQWRKSGDSLTVTLPPNLAGTVSIRVVFGKRRRFRICQHHHRQSRLVHQRHPHRRRHPGAEPVRIRRQPARQPGQSHHPRRPAHSLPGRQPALRIRRASSSPQQPLQLPRRNRQPQRTHHRRTAPQVPGHRRHRNPGNHRRPGRPGIYRNQTRQAHRSGGHPRRRHHRRRHHHHTG